MSENKIKILSTKILNSELIKEVRKNDYEITCMPFIDIQLVSNHDLKSDLKKIIETKPKALIFTSVNGVNGWIENAGKKVGPGTTIFCISGKTRDACIKFKGVENIYHKINSEKLVDTIIEHKSTLNNLYYITGNLHLKTIPNKLKEAGMICIKVYVYQNNPLNTKVDFIPDAVLFFSPSAVESYFSQNKIYNHTQYFAIGKTTANAIKHATYRTPIMPDFPSQEEMIKKLYEHYQSSQSYT